MSDKEVDDPTFVADLENSQRSVEVAARWLSQQGYPVVIRPTFVRPTVSEMLEYSDSGDLEIIQRVEVKQRVDIDFSGAGDFPYETVIVDACHCYDNSRPKPYAYIIFNASLSGALIVNVRETVSQWVKVEKKDRKKNRVRKFYECPVSAARFVDVEDEKGEQ
jgi:hypothetical protein